jgi:hypothetical protein
MPLPTPVPVDFTTKETTPIVLEVKGADGKRYEVRMALLVTNVIDSGTRNPLDGMPILQMGTQVVVQVNGGSGKTVAQWQVKLKT